MSAKVKQDDLHVKLMHSMDIIENNMYKDINSSISRSCRSRDEKRREQRSVGNRSLRKEHSSSIPSPIKNHNRSNGLDEIQG